jgi:SAM-dependent methyltransferase
MSQADHVHYNHYSAIMIQRLDGFFGVVDESINKQIHETVEGTSVLDIGCGFGSLVDYLGRHSIKATGIDMLEFCVAAGKERFPQADLRFVPAEGLPFDDQSFDTVTLKDTLHHLFAEADTAAVMREIRRVCRKRVVVMDPNPTLLLLAARKLIGHVDAVCSPKDACRILEEGGFLVKTISFSEVIGFPLSGGYVGPPMVPRIPWLFRAVNFMDRAALRLIQTFGLSEQFCWRYLIIADRAS